MNYTCSFRNETGSQQFGEETVVDAQTPEEAVEKFLVNKEKLYPYCLVVWGWGNEKFVSLHNEIKKFEEQQQQVVDEVAQTIQGKVDYLKNISFLELPAEIRDEIYDVVSHLSAKLEKGPLAKEEIEFLKVWHRLEDKELGESLLSENEMSKPESERGKSPFSKVWGAAFAMQGMATQNTLNEIADDVGDISDGGSSGGFE